jgi:hypothetical protein
MVGKRPTSSVRDRRRLKRDVLKKRGSLILHLGGSEQRNPCIVLDSSEEGFRIRGALQLRRGQVVELVLDEDPLKALRCNVVWVGKPGSKNEGEAGLQTE